MPGPTREWPPRRIGIGAAAAARGQLAQPRIVDRAPASRRSDAKRSSGRRPGRLVARRAGGRGGPAVDDAPHRRARPGRSPRASGPSRSRSSPRIDRGRRADGAERPASSRASELDARSPRSSTSARTRQRARAPASPGWPPTSGRRRRARPGGRRAIVRTAPRTGARRAAAGGQVRLAGGQRPGRGHGRPGSRRAASRGPRQPPAARAGRRPDRRPTPRASAAGRCRPGRSGSRPRSASPRRGARRRPPSSGCWRAPWRLGAAPRRRTLARSAASASGSAPEPEHDEAACPGRRPATELAAGAARTGARRAARRRPGRRPRRPRGTPPVALRQVAARPRPGPSRADRRSGRERVEDDDVDGAHPASLAMGAGDTEGTGRMARAGRTRAYVGLGANVGDAGRDARGARSCALAALPGVRLARRLAAVRDALPSA